MTEIYLGYTWDILVVKYQVYPRYIPGIYPRSGCTWDIPGIYHKYMISGDSRWYYDNLKSGPPAGPSSPTVYTNQDRATAAAKGN